MAKKCGTKIYGFHIWINKGDVKMQIGVVDHSFGNVGSLVSALRFLNYNVQVIKNYNDLETVDIAFLSGVGCFESSVEQLKHKGLWDYLNDFVIEQKKPIVGIGLGMQLFSDYSEEGNKNKGFGWIPGNVKKINDSDVKIPYIGWKKITYTDCNLFSNIKSDMFYFMHSYRFIPQDESIIYASTSNGDNQITAAIMKDNIVGFQFHPEKSQMDGQRVLKNVIEGFRCRVKE